MSATLDTALRCAARGWPAFPCKPGGKAPLTGHGLLNATTDADELCRMWRPNANVAVRTGRESGFVVLDVDGDVGSGSLRALERVHGELPRTLSAKTPREGQHFYFRHPGWEVRNSAGQLGEGLDVRGDGGYVLVPPSRSASGRPYEVDEQAPIAPMPAWLLALMRPPNGNGKARAPAQTWVAMVRQGLAQGERNAGLTRIVGYLLARDVDARLVAELAHLVNERSRPPLAADEVDRVVASIAGREVRRRRGSR